VGVCPDAGLGNSAADNNVKLLSCSYTNGITRVEFERPLKAHDKFDWAWPTGGLSCPVVLCSVVLMRWQDATGTLLHLADVLHLPFVAKSHRNQSWLSRCSQARPAELTTAPVVVGAAQPTTWAMGPLSDGSTVETPVVLYHQINVRALTLSQNALSQHPVSVAPAPPHHFARGDQT